MTKEEKQILKKAVDSNDGLISPASMINSYAGGNQRLVETLVSNGYLERVYQFKEGIHQATYSVIFYAVTEKGQMEFKPKITFLWFYFKNNIALWVGLFSILVGSISVILTGLSYTRTVAESEILNRPYLFVDSVNLEAESMDGIEKYKVIMKIRNEGNSVAVNSNTSVFVGSKRIGSSSASVVSPRDENTGWVFLSSASLNSIKGNASTGDSLMIRLSYEDLFKKSYCVESRYSVIKIDETLMLPMEGSKYCENENHD